MAKNIEQLKKEKDEESLITAGQRRINILWEVTQSIIAIAVTSTVLYVSAVLILQGKKEVGMFLLLSNSFFLIIGFYFGRTNHQRVGGVGNKERGR